MQASARFGPLATPWPRTRHLPGIVLCLGVAVSSYLVNVYVYNRISALLWAFVFSIILGNVFSLKEAWRPGIGYAGGTLLRASIAVFGLTVSALAWFRVGLVGLLMVLVVIAFALIAGLWLARRVGLSPTMGALIAGGTAICGASAIAAIGPSVKAKDEEIGMALTCVTLFGLVAMALYPLLFQATLLGDVLHRSDLAFGVWAGLGIHETAQVIGAASQVSDRAMQISMATKSVRIFSIAPIILLLAASFGRRRAVSEAPAAVPMFALVFVLFTLVNSALLALPAVSADWTAFSNASLKPAVTFLLAVAFAGVGFKVNFRSFTDLGIKAFLAGLAVALLTSLLALLLVVLVYVPANGI